MNQLQRTDATTSTPSREAISLPLGMSSTISTHEAEQAANQPLGEGVRDELGTDARHTIIREAAYHIYEQRGCIDGFAVDDWLAAEAEVDHLP